MLSAFQLPEVSTWVNMPAFSHAASLERSNALMAGLSVRSAFDTLCISP